jgi:hypothetical protein
MYTKPQLSKISWGEVIRREREWSSAHMQALLALT